MDKSLEELLRDAPEISEEEDFWEPDELCHSTLQGFMIKVKEIDKEEGWDKENDYKGEVSLNSIGDDFRKVDYEMYRDSFSVDLYNEFINNWKEDLSVEDVRALMYGYTFTEEYAKHSETGPFDFECWEEELSDNGYLLQKGMIAKAIISTGDGKTPQTAFCVIDIYQEYELLSILMPECTPLVKKQELLSGNIDCLEFEPNCYGIERMYFDMSRRFEVGYYNEMYDSREDGDEEQ